MGNQKPCLLFTDKGNLSKKRLEYTLKIFQEVTADNFVSKARNLILGPRTRSYTKKELERFLEQEGYPIAHSFIDDLIEYGGLVADGEENGYTIYRLDRQNFLELFYRCRFYWETRELYFSVIQSVEPDKRIGRDW